MRLEELANGKNGIYNPIVVIAGRKYHLISAKKNLTVLTKIGPSWRMVQDWALKQMVLEDTIKIRRKQMA